MKTYLRSAVSSAFCATLLLAGCGGGNATDTSADTPSNPTSPDPAPTYVLSVSKSGSGTVTSDLAGIACGSDCSESYASDATVTLTAAAATDFVFSGWSGDCSGSVGTCVVTMGAARNVTATFSVVPAASSYTLSVTVAGAGTVKSDPAGITDCTVSCSASFANGTRVVLTASPVAGHTFSGWSGSGCSGVTPCTVEMSAARSVTAGFSGPPDNSLSDFERHLVELPPDTWYEVPNTPMKAVCPPSPGGVQGCEAVINSWSGGAYDPLHRKLLIWGGGHNDYWGNEVYSFDLRTGKWERLTDPSPTKDPVTGAPLAGADVDPLSDGNPVSRHTYDGLVYITHVNRFLGEGGSRAWSGGPTSVTWLFDVEQRKWTDVLDPKMVAAGGSEAGKLLGPGGYENASGYDPASGLVFMRMHALLYSYDVNVNQWKTVTGFTFNDPAKPASEAVWPRYDVSGAKRAAIDTKRRLFWSVGSNDYLVWDIAQAKLVTNDWVTTGGGDYSNEARLGKNTDGSQRYPGQVFRSGGGDIMNAGAPGFDYDAKADQFVAWKGGSPYVLNLATKVWTIKNATGAPAAQTVRGTFGRWRYLERYNVFILVNEVSSNVYFYKNSAGGP
ncbi:MAG: hypothetical protein HY308_02870 [Gammaproteobacteria bacterium]|nr:hypothetical protein [Gammaproteobacteria bacterium]